MNYEIRMSIDELPEGWQSCALGDVVDYGKTQKAEPSEIPAKSWILELEDIEKDTSRLLSRVTFAERKSKSTKNRFETGDVLYGKLRPYLNKILIADQPGYCTTEIIPLRGNGTLENRFLFYWLKHPAFLDYVTAVSHGLNMPRLGTEAGKAAPFILAPLPEQKRIADKLDAVLTRVDACRARLDRVPALLKRFRQSVLAAATSGRLTAEWRMTNGVNDEWDNVAVSAVCHSITDGDHQAPPQATQGIPFITISAINNGKLRLDKATRSVAISYYEQLKDSRKPKIGDVLYSVTGSIGIPAIVDVDERFTFQRHIAILKPNLAQITTEYLNAVLDSEDARSQAISVATGTAQLTIPLNCLRNIQVPLPPLPEQQEIVRRVEDMFAFADRIEARLATAQKTVERLTPAVLAKAFRGELVPQDPRNEPAAALLERNKGQIAINPKKDSRKKPVLSKTRTQKKTKKSMSKSRFDEDVNKQPYLALLIKNSNETLDAEKLHKTSQLPIVDFYKQLAWEIEQGFIEDDPVNLKATA